ncbi:MAG: hypothetical protein ABSH16_01185 [Sedimentisphaerales bacterium]
MSSREETSVSIKKNVNGTFSVNMFGKIFCVDTEEEAKGLLILPEEYNSIFPNSPKSPNVENIKKVISVCDEYKINCFAVRKLKNWLKKHNQ